MRPSGLCLLAVLLGAACRQDMHDAPSHEAYEPSDFFADGRSARPRVPGTVARGHLAADEALQTGRVGAAFVADPPLALSLDLLRRGRGRYEIFCSPCHGLTGRGDGVVVRRGYSQPASLHTDRMRTQPAGHLFDVMTRGFGAMPDYAHVAVADRWAIVAYIRALQLSQNATLADVPPDARVALTGGSPAP